MCPTPISTSPTRASSASASRAAAATCCSAGTTPGATLLEIRVVRSTEAFASDADDPARPVGQRIVFQGVAGSFRDTDVIDGGRYFYTVFARHPDDLEWTFWERHRVVAGRPYRPGLLARVAARLLS
jgi:hypothetical protein